MIVKSCDGAKEHCCLFCLHFVEFFFLVAIYFLRGLA